MSSNTKIRVSAFSCALRDLMKPLKKMAQFTVFLLKIHRKGAFREQLLAPLRSEYRNALRSSRGDARIVSDLYISRAWASKLLKCE